MLTALANGLWMGLILTVVVACVLRPVRGLSAATRYAIWWSVLAIVAMLPCALYRPPVSDATPAPVASAAFPEKAIRAGAPPSATPPVSAVEPLTATVATPAVRLPLEIRISRSVSLRIVAVWAFAILFGAGRLMREAIALSRFRRRCRPAPDHIARRFEGWLRATRTSRTVRVATSDDARGPLAIGFLDPVIVLPAQLVGQLSGREIDQLLLHELAHLRRRDDWARLAQRAVETLLFFHPAALWVGRELDLEREIACDDWVVAVTGEARDYASCLTRVAELSGFRSHWALATGAAETKSHLIRRVESMLDKTRNNAPAASKPVLAIVILTAVLVALGAGRVSSVFAFTAVDGQDWPAPAPPAPPIPVAVPEPPAPMAAPEPPTPVAAPEPPVPAVPPSPGAPSAPPEPLDAPYSCRGDCWHSSWSENGRSVSLDVNGTVEFTDDDRDVKSVSPNGHFSIEARSGFATKRYEVRADSNGNLVRVYLENGRAGSLDEGRPWLAGTLPEVIRETAVGAGPRIQRIAQRTGTPAAIREIGLIHSDHSKRVYILEMLNRVPLDDGQLGETTRLLRSIGSDGEKAAAVIAAAPRYLKPGMRERMFEAIDTIGSDGERRRVLCALLQTDGANPGTAVLAIRSASHIGSDGEKAAVLVQASRSADGDEVRRAWFRAANSIGSDGEHARTLLAMLDRSSSPETLAESARSARRISSDGEKAHVLVRIARENLGDASVRTAFIEAAGSISSDGEHARTLLALIGRSGLPDDTVIAGIHSAARISSDGEKARVLTEIAGRYGRSPAVSRELRIAAKTVSSDGEYRRVMTAVERQSPTI